MLCVVGLIPNADDDVVSQVENMVKQYISFPSMIILVTVPAEGAFLPLRAVAHSVVSLTMPSDSDSADDLENQNFRRQ